MAILQIISFSLGIIVSLLTIRVTTKSSLTYHYEIEYDNDLEALSKKLKELQQLGDAKKIDEQRRTNLDHLTKRVHTHEFERRRDLVQIRAICVILTFILIVTLVEYHNTRELGSLLYLIFTLLTLLNLILILITLRVPFLTRIAAKHFDYFHPYTRQDQGFYRNNNHDSRN